MRHAQQVMSAGIQALAGGELEGVSTVKTMLGIIHMRAAWRVRVLSLGIYTLI